MHKTSGKRANKTKHNKKKKKKKKVIHKTKGSYFKNEH